MQHLYFVQESPKEKSEDMSEEENISNIFPLICEKPENFDEITLDRLYYLNDSFPQKSSTKNESELHEDSPNQLILINDYEAVFNQIKSNSNNNQENNNIMNCYNYNSSINENYENDEYNQPSFIKNIVKNNCFSPIKDETEEIIIKLESIKDKLKKAQQKSIRRKKENNDIILK